MSSHSWPHAAVAAAAVLCAAKQPMAPLNSRGRTHAVMHAIEPTMATTRFKCPGCDLTFSETSGIIKHLKRVLADHPFVAPPITQEATRVVCSMKDGFWVVEAPPTTAPTGQSRSWRHVMGFVGETGASKFSSDQGKFYSCLVLLIITTNAGDFIIKAHQLMSVHVDTARVAKINVEFKSWKSAASAFFTMVNQRIAEATPGEVR